jgi:hypothetical protein
VTSDKPECDRGPAALVIDNKSHQSHEYSCHSCYLWFKNRYGLELWEPMGRPRIEVRDDNVAKASVGGYHGPNGEENRKNQ